MNDQRPKGVLIAIEGIDGAGKTTQAVAIAHEIQTGLGREVVRSKEPTDGTWGRQLRESGKTGRLSLEQELDLFLKDRREHVERLIRPALDAGKVVIIDRYYYSTIAYQGARGMDPVAIRKMNEEFAPRPDILFLIDVEPEVGLERIEKRGDSGNHFEQLENLQAVADVFRSLEADYLVRVRGDLPVDVVTFALMERLCEGPLSTRMEPRGEAVPKYVNDQIWTLSTKVRDWGGGTGQA